MAPRANPSLQQFMETEKEKLRDSVRRKIPDHIHVRERVSGYKGTTRQFSFEGRMEEIYREKAQKLIDAQLAKMEKLSTADAQKRQEVIQQTRFGLQVLRGQLEAILDVYTGKDRVLSLAEIEEFERTVEPVLSAVGVEELVGKNENVTTLLQRLRNSEISEENGTDVLTEGGDLYPLLISYLDERVFERIAIQAAKKEKREKVEAKESYGMAVLVVALANMTWKQRATFIERVANSEKSQLAGKLLDSFVGNGLISVRHAKAILSRISGKMPREEFETYARKLESGEYQKLQARAREIVAEAQKKLEEPFKMNPVLKYGDFGNLAAYEIGAHWGILVMILNVIACKFDIKEILQNEYFWMGAAVTAVTTEYATGGIGKGKFTEWLSKPPKEKIESEERERYRRIIDGTYMNYPELGDYFVEHFADIDRVLQEKKKKTKERAPLLDIEKDFPGDARAKTLDHLEIDDINQYLTVLYYFNTEIFKRRDKDAIRDYFESLKKRQGI